MANSEDMTAFFKTIITIRILNFISRGIAHCVKWKKDANFIIIYIHYSFHLNIERLAYKVGSLSGVKSGQK